MHDHIMSRIVHDGLLSPDLGRAPRVMKSTRINAQNTVQNAGRESAYDVKQKLQLCSLVAGFLCTRRPRHHNVNIM